MNSRNVLNEDLFIHLLSFTHAKDQINILLSCKRAHRLAYGKLKNNRRGWLNPSAHNNRAILWASSHDEVQILHRLLKDHRVDPSAHNNWAIQWASRYGHLNVVERLLQDDRVDPSARNNLAIRWANDHGRVKVVERLLQDDRVDPSANHNEAI